MSPLMPKATAVWLVDHTTLTFDQIADFTGLHPLEVSGIADGEVAVGMKGFDPVANSQLTRAEIAACEADPKRMLKLARQVEAPPVKKKAPRYTPLSKRQERPAAIAWLVRNHPELTDGQISKLLGTTKTTIEAIRNKTHWNSTNIQPVDPVALGLCRQIDLDAAVAIAAKRRAELEPDAPEPAPDEALMSTSDSLKPAIKGFENIGEFSLEEEAARAAAAKSEEEAASAGQDAFDPDALFNLPKADETADAEAEADAASESGESRP